MLSDGARLKAIRFPFGENTGRPTNAEPKSRTVSTLESDSLTVEMLQSKRPDPALVSTRHRDDARSSGGIPGSPKRAGLATPLWSEVARAFPPVWEPLAVRVESADLQRGDESAQLVGRVGWAVHDADDAERPTSSVDSPGPGARPDKHPK